jgi:two-component system, NtrC family, response regulator GlrR
MRVLVFSFKSLTAPFSALVNLLTSADDFGVRAVEVQVKEAQCEGIDLFIPKILAEHLPDLAIVCWPGENEIFREAFSKIKSSLVQGMPVIIAFDETPPSAICEVLRQGANDFFISPFRPVDVLPRLWQLVQTWTVQDPLLQHLKERCGLRQFVGRSKTLLTELQKLPPISRSDLNVLILGETGTGKEICAHAIHHLSARFQKPFIPVNCGAVPVELVENELFGHESGAYTSASTSHRGLIQEARGGTVFLDEIECLHLVAQAKLLRFLQEKEFKPLGGCTIQHADVRIIAASNVDLDQAVLDGRFRRDLFYRLNVVSLRMPPLRDRPEDIPLLARHFLARSSLELAKPVKDFTAGAMQKLALHNWPGNVRELKNIIESAVLFAERAVLRETDILLPAAESSPTSDSFKVSKASMIAAFEKTYISEKLRAYAGNISQAARASKQHPRAFRRLIHKYHLHSAE